MNPDVLTPEQIAQSRAATAWLMAPYDGKAKPLPEREPETKPRITGYLSIKSPHFEDFVEVFGSNEVPLESAEAVWANLPGIGENLVYRLDWRALTVPQFERLADYLSARFGTARGEVRDILEVEGLPVLADELTVRVSQSEAHR